MGAGAPGFAADLRPLAVEALDRVVAEASELAELWDETSQGPKRRRSINRIRAAASRGARRIGQAEADGPDLLGHGLSRAAVAEGADLAPPLHGPGQSLLSRKHIRGHDHAVAAAPALVGRMRATRAGDDALGAHII
ncbi:DUF4259 domain-containing protein [Streptomyces sp. NPDC001380]|uniref:DUF4259 domain-containing protein n=1 Tax=Streptomyces sp. NPDC001380 TaxID=3364566 RepID=UPI00367CD84F